MVEKSIPKHTEKRYQNNIPNKSQKIIIFYRQSAPPGDPKLVQNRYQLGAKTPAIFYHVAQASHAAVMRESSGKAGHGGSCPLKTIDSPGHRGTVGHPEH